MAGGWTPPWGSPWRHRWEALTELPRGVNHAGLEYHDGRLYVIAGDDEATFEPSDDFHIYDIDADKWRQGPVVPTPRGALATAVLDGRIHAIGGTTHGREDVSVHEVYDPQRDAWSQLAAMPTPRNHQLDDWVYLFGGETFRPERRTFDEAERYHLEEDRWERLPAMPTARHGLDAAAVDGAIYVISGGPDAGLAFSDLNERLTPEE